MSENQFKGPLFIVGTARSGTKLLRDLLNQNHKIGITRTETHFFPSMVKRFGNPPVFELNEKEFDRFYNAFTRTNFYWSLKKYGFVLEKDYLYRTADRKSWSSIFEIILKFYAPPDRDENFIWGDKTPGLEYLNHISLLKEIFPEAKFIHIIRDPRDCCLSFKKTWGKSLYRTATLWRLGIESARASSKYLGGDYKEVLFEDLLQEPENVLRDICCFLEIEFVPCMLKLNSPAEFSGAGKGKTEIDQNNKNKYLSQLSPSQVKRIEEITYPVAKSLGYNFENKVEYKPLSKISYSLLYLYDGLKYFGFNIKEKGSHLGITYIYRSVLLLLRHR